MKKCPHCGFDNDDNNWSCTNCGDPFPLETIPSENKKEAIKIRKAINSNIQIFDVATIDEAIDVVEKINEK